MLCFINTPLGVFVGYIQYYVYVYTKRQRAYEFNEQLSVVNFLSPKKRNANLSIKDVNSRCKH